MALSLERANDLELLSHDFLIEETLKDSHDFLNTNRFVLDRFNDSLHAIRILEDLMPQDSDRFMSGHMIPLLETYSELEAVIQLTLRGFYRQAFTTLRTAIELGILSVFIDINETSHIKVKEWNQSGHTPQPFKMLSAFEAVRTFKAYYVSFPDFNESILSQYKRLHDFVHVRGAKHTSRALNKTNTFRFESESIKAISFHFKKAVKHIAIIHILRYPVALQEFPLEEKFGLNPPAGGFLTLTQSDFLRTFIGAREIVILQSISDNDEATIATGDAINALADLSPADLEKQYFRNSQQMVLDYNGFLNWYNHCASQDSYCGDPEFKSHLRAIEKWALEEEVLTEQGVASYRKRKAAVDATSQ